MMLLWEKGILNLQVTTLLKMEDKLIVRYIIQIYIYNVTLTKTKWGCQQQQKEIHKPMG
jgi:hypothetical protein